MFSICFNVKDAYHLPVGPPFISKSTAFPYWLTTLEKSIVTVRIEKAVFQLVVIYLFSFLMFSVLISLTKTVIKIRVIRGLFCFVFGLPV